MKVIVKDIEDPTYPYCILTCIDMPVEKLQAKINNIKTRYADVDWTYDEIFDKLPKEWNVKYKPFDCDTVYI